MQRISVTSEAIASVGYDPRERILEIEFHEGHIYHYFTVPADRATALVSADSPGHYFQEFIRDHYPYRKVR